VGMIGAVVITPDAPARLAVGKAPAPTPAPSEAVVRVAAVSLNPVEVRRAQSADPGTTIGEDVAGTIVQTAADGSGPTMGTRVIGWLSTGAWAEEVAVPTDALASLPEGVELTVGATLPTAGLTAMHAVDRGGSLLGRRVLVTGASGGVGHLAVQLAALGGAEVVGMARAERADAVRGWGAGAVVGEPSEADGLFELVLESVGGAALEAALDRVAPAGTVILFGNSSREPARLDFSAMHSHEEATIRSYFSARHEADAGRTLRRLLDLVAAGRLQVEIGARESWDRLNEVMDGLSERRFAGKAVLTVD
jgi:NADPH:quinone reductase